MVRGWPAHVSVVTLSQAIPFRKVLVELARRHGSLVWSLPDATQHPGHAGWSVGVTNFSGRGISADVPPSQ
jgi:hypothetical protein